MWNKAIVIVCILSAIADGRLEQHEKAAVSGVATKKLSSFSSPKVDEIDVSGPMWKQPACKEEIAAFECDQPEDKAKKDNNFAIILCLTNRATTKQLAAEREGDQGGGGAAQSDKAVLSDACQHIVWSYKREITNDKNVVSKITEACSNDEDGRALKDCKDLYVNEKEEGNSESKHNGHILSCMIEKKYTDGEYSILSFVCLRQSLDRSCMWAETDTLVSILTRMEMPTQWDVYTCKKMRRTFLLTKL
jgi:hypothetical protein